MKPSTNYLNLFMNMMSSNRMTLMNTLLISTFQSRSKQRLFWIVSKFSFFAIDWTHLFMLSFHVLYLFFLFSIDKGMFSARPKKLPFFARIDFLLGPFSNPLLPPQLQHLHLVFHLNMSLVFFNTMIMKLCSELEFSISFGLFLELRGGSFDSRANSCLDTSNYVQICYVGFPTSFFSFISFHI